MINFGINFIIILWYSLVLVLHPFDPLLSKPSKAKQYLMEFEKNQNSGVTTDCTFNVKSRSNFNGKSGSMQRKELKLIAIQTLICMDL